jgi:hypothetical protein
MYKIIMGIFEINQSFRIGSSLENFLRKIDGLAESLVIG